MSDIISQNLDNISSNKCLINDQLSPILNKNDNYYNIDFNSDLKANINVHKNTMKIPKFDLNTECLNDKVN
jgi:hypothetical protein